MTPEERFKALYRIDESGCWLWIGVTDKRGYGLFHVAGKRLKMFAHRFAYTLAHPSELLTSADYICHTCDVPGCVNWNHLYRGTPATNMRDRRERGRANCHGQKGERNCRALLNDISVRAIRAASASGVTYKELAERYGVGEYVIGYAVRRETWRHVE